MIAIRSIGICSSIKASTFLRLERGKEIFNLILIIWKIGELKSALILQKRILII